jgi:hypothetical protein
MQVSFVYSDGDTQDIRFAPANAPLRSKVALVLSRAKAKERVLPEDAEEVERLCVDMAQYIASLERELTVLQSSNLSKTSEISATGANRSEYADPAAVPLPEEPVLTDQMQALTLDSAPRFYGRFSHMNLVQSVIRAKEDAGATAYHDDIQVPTSFWDLRRKENWNLRNVRC